MIAFEFGRDVMERLRGAHPAVSAVMEIMLTDIGACKLLVACLSLLSGSHRGTAFSFVLTHTC